MIHTAVDMIQPIHQQPLETLFQHAASERHVIQRMRSECCVSTHSFIRGALEQHKLSNCDSPLRDVYLLCQENRQKRKRGKCQNRYRELFAPGKNMFMWEHCEQVSL